MSYQTIITVSAPLNLSSANLALAEDMGLVKNGEVLQPFFLVETEQKQEPWAQSYSQFLCLGEEHLESLRAMPVWSMMITRYVPSPKPKTVGGKYIHREF